jgi:Na+/melibiose symporter-like transporter
MAETKNISLAKMLNEYKVLIPRVLKNREILKVIAIAVILHIAFLISNSFFGLYVTQRLGIAQGYLAFFPILNAAVMLIFMVGIQHRLDAVKFRIPMWGGFFIYIACVILLILMPTKGSIPFIIIYVFFGAVAGAMLVTRKDALLQLTIDPEERARINALIMAFTIAFASPFGYFAGWLSSIDRRLPFVFILVLFIVAIIIVGRIRDPEFAEDANKD